MELQTCRKCGGAYPVNFFPVAGTINGKLYRRRKCNKCYVSMKGTRRSSIRVWFEDYKKTVRCQRCGLQDHRVIDFHHEDEDEKEDCVSILVMHACSMKKILEEIRKCSPLCANCHRILHYEEKRGLAQLG